MELNEIKWNWMKWNGIELNEMELKWDCIEWLEWNINDWVLRNRMIWFEIYTSGGRLGETEYGGNEIKWNGIK